MVTVIKGFYCTPFLSTSHSFYTFLFPSLSPSQHSLPRHKVSGAIKGFAFVEFSTQQEAETAVEVSATGQKKDSLS